MSMISYQLAEVCVFVQHAAAAVLTLYSQRQTSTIQISTIEHFLLDVLYLVLRFYLSF